MIWPIIYSPNLVHLSTLCLFLSDRGFVIVISTESYVHIELDAYGMTDLEMEKLREHLDKKNPFQNSLSLQFPLKRWVYQSPRIFFLGIT